MAAKAVVRDVARAQGKSFGLADKLSKMIPPDPGMELECGAGARSAFARHAWQRRRSQRNLGYGH